MKKSERVNKMKIVFLTLQCELVVWCWSSNGIRQNKTKQFEQTKSNFESGGPPNWSRQISLTNK